MEYATQLSVVIFFSANLMYCVAYVVRDILWLRILTVLAALMTIPYFIMQAEILYSALLWQCAFAVINIVNIIRLLHENRPAIFSEREQRLKNLVFPHFNNAQLKKLFAIAEWKTGVIDEQLISSSEKLQQLYLLEQGAVDIWQSETCIARRLPGTFMGELSFMTGDLTSADIRFSETSHYLAWDIDSLRRLLNSNDELSRAFDSLLSIDVARKLNNSQSTPACT